MSKKIPSVLDNAPTVDFDPWSENLTAEQKAEVITKCREDMLFFFNLVKGKEGDSFFIKHNYFIESLLENLTVTKEPGNELRLGMRQRGVTTFNIVEAIRELIFVPDHNDIYISDCSLFRDNDFEYTMKVISHLPAYITKDIKIGFSGILKDSKDMQDTSLSNRRIMKVLGNNSSLTFAWWPKDIERVDKLFHGIDYNVFMDDPVTVKPEVFQHALDKAKGLRQVIGLTMWLNNDQYAYYNVRRDTNLKLILKAAQEGNFKKIIDFGIY